MNFWQGQDTLTVVEWFTRALVGFLWLLLITKLMGQREIGRLTLFVFVIAVSIGSVMAAPLSNNTISIMGSLISVAALGGINIAISYLSLKNPFFRRIVQDEPLVLIQNGKILEDTLRKARFNLDDLLTELRQKNLPNVHDVEFAILESNGRLSVIPKSQARPARPQDFSVQTPYEGLPTVLIEDGNIVEDNLRENGLSKDWLFDQLHRYGLKNSDTVMAAILDTQGRFYISKSTQTNDQPIH